MNYNIGLPEGRRVDLANESHFVLGGLHVVPSLCRVWSTTMYQLEPRVMQVLVALVDHSPQVVSRELLIERCWGGRIVSEDAINRTVGRLRKLCHADGVERFQIETFKKLGYRLLGEVSREGPVKKERTQTTNQGQIQKSVGSDRGIPAIAVLPFRHPEDDISQAYFAEGMAEEIIADLTHVPLLRVISPLSSLTYCAGNGGARKVCSDLGVRYVVEGQIRRLGEQLRLVVTLTDGSIDETIWSARYERSINDLFAVQTEVAAGIVGAIGPAILSHEQVQSRCKPSNLGFWELFIGARFHFWRGTIQDFEQASSLLGQALALKPEDSVALSLLAMVNLSKVWAGGHPNPSLVMQKAESAAREAIAANNRCPDAHHVMGIVFAQLGEHAQAVGAQRRALELRPNNAQAMGELARLMAFGGGDADEVLRLADVALLLSPTDPHDWLWLRSKAIALLLYDRGSEALLAARAACARRPDYFFLHLLVAACAAEAGEIGTARAACTQGKSMHPGYNLRGLRLGHPFVHEHHLLRFVAALELAGWGQNS
jgi:TolB-like protein/Flp pilus assembly protein TadD